MMTIHAKRIAYGIAVLALVSARPLYAQMEVGTWVRQATASMPAMTMEVEACCDGGRRLIYHILIGGVESLLTVESRFNGSDAPVLMNGKSTGETMAITRGDAHHASAIVRMNGNVFGTSQASLSGDGRTLTVINEFSSSAGGQQVGKYTEVWVRK